MNAKQNYVKPWAILWIYKNSKNVKIKYITIFPLDIFFRRIGPFASTGKIDINVILSVNISSDLEIIYWIQDHHHSGWLRTWTTCIQTSVTIASSGFTWSVLSREPFPRISFEFANTIMPGVMKIKDISIIILIIENE